MNQSEFEALLAGLRPKLHRYCARMTGSAIDGEDVLQEALIKAVRSWPASGEVVQPDRWLFRIAHNTALDFLRRRARAEARRSDEDPETMIDSTEVQPDPEVVALSFRTFMRLPPVQRSSVILMDVLGYSLNEIGEIMEAHVPAVKSALHRGRMRLHEIASEPPDAAPPAFSEKERTLLARYIDRFNAHDYDSLRAMLAEEVRLDLVNRRRIEGPEVRTYYANYATATPRNFRLGYVDGHPAILVYEQAVPDVVSYFIVLDWHETSVSRIRDFLYAPYALEGADVRVDIA